MLCLPQSSVLASTKTEETKMEELSSVWFYQETIDELRQKLQYTSVELEAMKTKTDEQTKKHKEEIKNILALLKAANQERDEAKDQLRSLLKIPPIRGNSSITESNSLTQSRNSSPVDSFFDTIISPEFNTTSEANYQIGFGNQQPVLQNCSIQIQTAGIDPTDAVIDDLVKCRILPQKGKLLQTVMESGPLLQTLLLAGPLPRWRNPPPLQPFKVPPFSINGRDSVQKPAISRGFSGSQMCSSVSMTNFGCLGLPGINTQIPLAKRQKFH